MKSQNFLRVLPISLLGCMTAGASVPVDALQPLQTTAHAHAAELPQPIIAGPAAEPPQPEQLASTGAHLWRNGSVEAPGAPSPPPTSERQGHRPDHALDGPAQRRLPASPTTPALSTPVREAIPPDPADEVAPAVIELTPGTSRLNPVLAHAMDQQLRNLIGRFESALLISHSLESSTTLSLEAITTDLTAAEKEAPAAASADTAIAPDEDLPPALDQAQQLLEDWDTLIAAGHHTEAQERWLQARNDLWQNMPVDRPYAQAEIRAMWLDRGTIVDAGSAQGLEQIFDRLAAAGINTVFLETVNAGYPIYPSRVAPQQNPLIGPWDPLRTAVELAHERDMTLHAWVWVFAAGNERHNRIVNLPADYLGPILSGNPDWAGYDNRGNPIPRGQDKPFLDPANPEARSYLTRLMTEIVTEYDVDGLQLDYIRYPFQDPSANRTYGYGSAARWRFRSMTGVDPLDLTPRTDLSLSPNEQARQRSLWDRWTEFRVQQVNSFVETLSHALKRQRPDLVLSAAVFAKPEHERLQKIQQDWVTWARNGDIDWIVLMSYAEDTSRFEQLISPWLLEADVGNALVIPGIRILDLPRPAVMDQLQVTRDLPTPGYALFATADLQTDLTTYLEQTQGQSLTQSSFQMAFDRFQGLQREWVWLLSQEKLWMQREQLTSWVTAVNQLEAEFHSLAELPSRRQLATVREGLARVQAPLEETVLTETVNSSYRVEAWRYRLLAIDRLLRYGEQSEFRDPAS